MAEYPYIISTSKIKPFFEHIQRAGIPSKVKQQYLNSVGFKSSNDRSPITIAKFLGFIDAGNSPSARWREYRNRQSAPRIMADALKEAYAELSRVYPDAHQKDNEALRNFIGAQTSLGQRAIGAAIAAFKTLCELADFDVEAAEEVVSEEVRQPPSDKRSLLEARRAATGVGINLNIQLQLPATDDASIYPTFPISACGCPKDPPSFTTVMVGASTNAVNYPIGLTKPSLGAVN